MKRAIQVMAILLVASMVLLGSTGCAAGDAFREGMEDGMNAAQTTAPEASAAGITLGDTFQFNDLEIMFGDTFGWTTVTSQFSEYFGAEVFYLPISVTNLREETHGLNMFAVNHFGAEGTSLSLFFGGFNSEANWSNNMRPGVTQEGNIYFLYDGDGEYVAEFTFGFGRSVEVVFQVEKP